jgi:hypothetical protein
MCAAGLAARGHAPRWAGLMVGTGLVYGANGVVIALRSLAVTPQWSALPLAAIGWVSDVIFPVCDVGLLGLMLATLPTGRPNGAARHAVRLLVALTAVTIVLEAFTPHVLGNTTVANPLAVEALRPLAAMTDPVVGLVYLYAVLLGLVRAIAVARQRHRAGMGGALAAPVAAVLLVLCGVGAGAFSQDDAWAGNLAILVPAAVATGLALHVVRSAAR